MDFGSSVVFAFITFIIFFFIFRIVKYGGIAAAMFGAPIACTIGEVLGDRSQSFMRFKIKVHKLDSDSAERAVGIEFVGNGGVSYQMIPVALSVTEALKLIRLLESATSVENAA